MTRSLLLLAALALTSCERGETGQAPPAAPGGPGGQSNPGAQGGPGATGPGAGASVANPGGVTPGSASTGVAASPGSAPVATGGPPSAAPSRVETRTFASRALGVDKRYVVYLPAGYEGSTARFPVIYLLHGLGGNESNWTAVGKLAEAADRSKLGAIVVMPDGDDGFYTNGPLRQPYEACLKARPPFDPGEPPASHCVRTGAYEDYVINDLVAHVDATLRTRADRGHRAVAGLSMGGFGAWQLALRHQDLFAAAASHSGMLSLLYDGPRPFAPGKATTATRLADWGKRYPDSFRRHVLATFGDDLATWQARDPATLVGSLRPGALALYLDCGDRDDFGFQDHAQHVHERLTAGGIDHQFAIVPGIHRFDLWRERLPHSLRFLQAQFARADAPAAR